LYVVLIGFNILSHTSDAMMTQNECFTVVSVVFVFFLHTMCSYAKLLMTTTINGF